MGELRELVTGGSTAPPTPPGLRLPASLSPSKVSTFTSCALAFRFSAIDRVPEPASVWTAKGTLVHRALERLYAEVPAGGRSVAVAVELLHDSAPLVLAEEGFEPEDVGEFVADAELLVANAFRLEDPNAVNAIGLELKLEATVGSLRLRGIIDRLDLREDGSIVVTDYKTGRAPSEMFERQSLGGVNFYAFLCERFLGRRPSHIQLLHLREPVAIVATPSDQSVAQLERRTSAIWSAVERACERNDFKPRPSRLCDFCAFKQWCPAFGGDPATAPTAVTRTATTPEALPALSVPVSA
jgi:putative RecB family exonuclease